MMHARNIAAGTRPRHGAVARLLYYFAAVGPGVLVTRPMLADLLWRGRADGGPDSPYIINAQISRARAHLLPGWAIIPDCGRGGPNPGWRLLAVAADYKLPGSAAAMQAAREARRPNKQRGVALSPRAPSPPPPWR